jgi:glycosyltransferase involved in cell wall biosynthesis
VRRYHPACTIVVVLRVVVVGDRGGFAPGSPAGNYVDLVCRALELDGASVRRLPPAGAATGRWSHLTRVRTTVRRDDPDVVVYYGHSLLMMAWAWLVTRRVSTRYVLHAVEWPPAARGPGLRAWAQAQAYARTAFRFADAVIVISVELEAKVASVARRRRRPLPAFWLPILVDRTVEPSVGRSAVDGRYLLYCGDLAGYRDDVLFIIRAFAALEHADDLQLVLVGRASEDLERALRDAAAAAGVDERLVLVREVLAYDVLLATYGSAAALLAPLEDDERSRSRFPSKLADYLLSSRPVVSTTVGEVDRLLHDGRDAYLAPPGSAAAFTAAIDRAIHDPQRDAVGRAGRQVAIDALDHRVWGARLATFLRTVAGR